MRARWGWTDAVIGISPFHRPDAGLAAAVCASGALGVLDLGAGDRPAREALAQLGADARSPYGVRVAPGCAVSPVELRAADCPPSTVLLASGVGAGWEPAQIRDHHRLLIEVIDLAEALDAVTAGAHGLIARGAESGGRVGELSEFVLLQQLLAAPEISVPIWACGGIGPRTAAAAVAAGAAGVVLDSQLALLSESSIPGEVAALVRRMDGSETVVVDGRRILKGRRGKQTIGIELAVGQDGSLAAMFAERWGTTGRALNAVRESISQLAAAAAVPDAAAGWLGPAAPLCEQLRTALPVVQGPMTRVSDQPEFAAAVAASGALPFVALALAGADQTRTLLTQTAAAVGDSPWGVGFLGFAPEDVRSAQLAEVMAVRPTHAIIAGGRPSQARALEEVGITTFLHVPSPGLLQQFLADGARRFVFEGAECGGHIGPRHSFALWETQLAVLEDFLASAKGQERVDVLFAGGIHDERSAALVAALAAPLAPRSAGAGGVAAGCLMGTAYLFTAEAVACGAVQPEFQRQVLRAQETTLLQTAPGHVTRCLPSAFAAEFEALRERLRAEGVADREIWERLERLNIGRLRIASKGLERVGADLVEVAEQEQVNRGMFMAGQVAVLRDSVTTVAELHTAVSTGAAKLLTERALTLRQVIDGESQPTCGPTAPMDIAVVGMACVFPQAPDLAAFWANIVAGRDAVTEVSPQRWDPARYWSADGGAGTTPSKWGGFLSPVPFDALGYGIPPTALGSIEPVQLLSLEVARRALVDAGYDPLGQGDTTAPGRSFDRSRTSVIFGAEAGSDLSGAGVIGALLPAYLGSVPEGIAAQLPVITEDTFPGVLSNVISGRIANRLDLGGSNFTVDAACASSLAALDVACKELLAGTADMALCGGADLHNGINDYLLFASVHALSPTGHSRPFDSSADGIALGEGVACLVLKRLADAERDGDRIYAVVAGVGSASDGRSLGLTAPRPEGQRAALDRAYRGAGISPAAVGLVEAHGTGTVVGDRTELTTLTGLFQDSGAAPEGCTLGSVKSQIGHTKCAAGLAGLIKAALALHTGVKPPTLHLQRPNPAWEAGTSPFAFHTQARPWPTPAAQRVAGVSSFGFGGTNFHAVLRAYDGLRPVHGLDHWPAELFVFRGADPASATVEVSQLLRLAEDPHSPWRLRDLALTASVRAESGHGPVQVAIVASDVAELVCLLRRATAGEHAPSAGVHLADRDRADGPSDDGASETGRTAFLFPGQGSQRVGMFAELFTAFPFLHRHLQLGPESAQVLFPAAAFTPEAVAEQRARVLDTRIAQPALGMAGLAAADLLAMAGVRPDLLGGHSYGELVALCAAGALAVADLPLLSHERGRVILEAVGESNDPGAMAAVVAEAAEVEAVLRACGLLGRVVLANLNTPRQTVISGATAELTEAMTHLAEAGFSVKQIAVACAFHSPVVARAGALFAEVLATREVRGAELPVFANRTAAPYPDDPAAIRAELVAQLVSPVRFTEQVEAMYAAGARVFVEAGPGSVLTKFVSAVLGDRPHRAISVEGRRDGIAGFLDALAELAVAGVHVDPGRLLRGRDAVDAGRAKAARRAGWTVDGHLVRTADGALLPGALQPARITELPWAANANGHGSTSAVESLIADFVRTGREMIAAQRDVLLAHLGAPLSSVPARLSAPVQTIAVVPQVVAAVAVAPATETLITPDAVLRAVIETIAERTGYPAEMIEPDLDLESDLSVDSIKRTEIVGLLARRLTGGNDDVGLDALSDAELEELSRARTAAAISDWISARLASPSATASVEPVAAEPLAPAEPAITGHAPARLVFARTPLPDIEAGMEGLSGRRFLLLGGDDTVGAVTTLLATHGAEAVSREATHETSPADGPIDGVLFLDPLCGDGPAVLPTYVPALQAVLHESPRLLLAARRVDDTPGGDPGRADGLRGLMRSLSREYPDSVVRLVDLDFPPTDPQYGTAEAIAQVLVAELCADDHEPVVLRGPDGRHGLTLTESTLGVLASTGAGPAGDGASEAEALGLDRDAVVLLVGGARGITARFAATLAGAARCHLELLGRTPLPEGPEEPATAQAHDRKALRAVLAGRGVPMAEIDATASALLAAREVSTTLAELRALGSPVQYRSVDAADPTALAQSVKEVYAAHGRLDGVVFAAGVVEDKLFAEKDPLSFARVFATKADGARALLDALGELPDGPRFTVLFGSIAAALGNRGQADYAAANDALESLGARWAQRTGCRALTVHWGPWAPTGPHGGMVSEELARDYSRRGIRLIDPTAGTLALLRELAWGSEALASVVYSASGW
jgi:acyl transferase domain-containing protein/NAD(P)H-dependent flavin oxidoreductase YrpB (nitropropane dioxygenase family)